MIYSSILEAIGNTPVVKLNNLSKTLDVNIFLKMESLNPGGSHKIRVAIGMIRDAERKGVLIPNSGQTLIEPSGGNTGIGLAMASNLLGYKLILVIPDNYSEEKQKISKLYGAEVVLSDSSIGNNSHGEKALDMQLDNPRYVMLNQQKNPANSQTHRESTALEILDDFNDMDLDYFFSGIGTGGHITGIGEVIKKRWNNINIIGVEPEGCDLLNNIHAKHNIQGLSVGIIPDILNIDIIDSMVKVTTEECLSMVKTMLQKESISLGISSAGSIAAIKKLVAENKITPRSNILTLAYDQADSYLNYF